MNGRLQLFRALTPINRSLWTDSVQVRVLKIVNCYHVFTWPSPCQQQQQQQLTGNIKCREWIEMNKCEKRK